MDTYLEKVYVILGNDLQDGFKTLDWTIKKWKPIPISIIILHFTFNVSKEFVYTPFGKLPASSVSEEKLQVLRRYEQEKIEKLLSKYISFCGKVKAEIFKVEKSDEPVQKVIVELISRYKITKLVLELTFLRSSSSWRSKNSISGSFYIHEHKPNFCEFFIICGGKLVFLRGENEDVIMEDDDQGLTKKGNIKSWFGKMLNDHNSSSIKNSHRLSVSSKSQNQWENCAQEIQNYYENLLSSNLGEDKDFAPLEEGVHTITESMNGAVKAENMRSKIDDVQKIIRLNKEEIKANMERSAKAEWALCLCNTRAEELEAKIKEEITNRMEIKKSLDTDTEQIQELITDISENKNKRSSLLELQTELSNKLQLLTLSRLRGEAQLDNAVIARAEMVRDIEELRRQRDVLQRRVEFCKEKDAIGMVTKLNQLSCGYREYSAEDIRLATDGFSERLRLKSGGDWTNVYRGRFHNTAVAVKLVNSDDNLSQEDFLAKVKLLNNIRHPHLLAIMGFCCSEPKSIIFEYLHNGSLRDTLLSSQGNHRKTNRALRWHDRIRIAHEVCSGLVYLHSARPRPIIHGHLTTSNILLDRNLVAKISGLKFGLGQCYDKNDDTRIDIRAFGLLVLNLLTGSNWAGLVDEMMTVDPTALVRVLDEVAGQWPLDLAEELVGIAMKCISINTGPKTKLSAAKVMEEMTGVRKKADEIVGKGGGCEAVVIEGVDAEVPSIFLCPIFQDVMKNPHIAADGFSYELEAIEEWLKMGRDTSPMTNLRLNHTFLIPNHTLRSLIQEWHNKNSILTS
ncbi:putative U-box domain-containing protein 50 [Mercurialis annua]|uniref:putative U-box domain-containing protein 50 n=1 Tax=Mercurialis annua TaxID=3986 RepID=UPI00215DDCAC|nr:putative U-box domain-containing protein 50 [Mercurialis annua]